MVQILTTMTSVVAPVLPYLAEEIFYTARGNENKNVGPSVFSTKWMPLVWYTTVILVQALTFTSRIPDGVTLKPNMIWTIYFVCAKACSRCSRELVDKSTSALYKVGALILIR
jgi:isoleucyl-tRNA synthetase